MMQLGIICPSCSNWSSPLHLVSKGNNAFYACGDYHALNSITRSELQLIPHIYDIIQSKLIFSKIDLIRAYNQLPIEPADIPKTVITTLFSLFEFLHLLFVLRNACQIFQRFIDHILHSLDFVCAYIADVLVASSLVEEHVLPIRIIFE